MLRHGICRSFRKLSERCYYSGSDEFYSPSFTRKSRRQFNWAMDDFYEETINRKNRGGMGDGYFSNPSIKPISTQDFDYLLDRLRVFPRSMPQSFSALLQMCTKAAPNVSLNKLADLIFCILVLNSDEMRSFSLPHFPLDSLLKIVAIWNTIPKLSSITVLELAYPYKALAPNRQQQLALERFLRENGIDTLDRHTEQPLRIESINLKNRAAEILCGSGTHSIEMPVGNSDESMSRSIFSGYVGNEEQESLLAKMVLSHAGSDFCILGPKECNKRAIVEEFINRLGYLCETISLKKNKHGPPTWDDNVLMNCARLGKICIVDGIEEADTSILEILFPVIQFRIIKLFDGTRFIGSNQYWKIYEETGFRLSELSEKRIFKVHPSFRIIAIGDSGGGSKRMNEQILSLFVFHTMELQDPDLMRCIMRAPIPKSTDDEPDENTEKEMDKRIAQKSF